MSVERNLTVLRRRDGITSVIVYGSYMMQSQPVRHSPAKTIRNEAKAVKEKAADKLARRDAPYGAKLTKNEKGNWCMGVRIALRNGIQGARRLSMNEMVSHMVAFGYPSALNW